MDKLYLTPKELAERWGYKTSTLAVWRCIGQGPSYIKMGHDTKSHIRYRLDEVIKYEQQKEGKNDE